MFVYNIKVNRYLRYQNTVSLGSDSPAQCSMSHISAEYLHDNNTVVAHSRCLDIPCKNSYPVDRRITSDTVWLKVKVHRLGDMNTRNTLRRKVDNNTARIIAAAYDQGIYTELLQAVLYPFIFVRVIYLAYLDP